MLTRNKGQLNNTISVTYKENIKGLFFNSNLKVDIEHWCMWIKVTLTCNRFWVTGTQTKEWKVRSQVKDGTALMPQLQLNLWGLIPMPDWLWNGLLFISAPMLTDLSCHTSRDSRSCRFFSGLRSQFPWVNTANDLSAQNNLSNKCFQHFLKRTHLKIKADRYFY